MLPFKPSKALGARCAGSAPTLLPLLLLLLTVTGPQPALCALTCGAFHGKGMNLHHLVGTGAGGECEGDQATGSYGVTVLATATQCRASRGFAEPVTTSNCPGMATCERQCQSFSPNAAGCCFYNKRSGECKFKRNVGIERAGATARTAAACIVTPPPPPPGCVAGSAGPPACDTCEAGKYQPSSGSAANACTDCSVGQHQPFSGRASCFGCPGGQYAPSSGAPSCTYCAAGRYTLSTGSQDSSACRGCPVGRYQDTVPSLLASCKSCPAGQYQDLQAQEECRACPAGQSQPSSSKSSCDHCQPGYAQGATGQTHCNACAAGTYQPLSTGATSCDPCNVCPAGKYASTGCTSVQDTLCTNCQVGRYQSSSSFDGASCQLCSTCAAGEFATSSCTLSANAVCDACPSGQYQSSSSFIGSECTPWTDCGTDPVSEAGTSTTDIMCDRRGVGVCFPRNTCLEDECGTVNDGCGGALTCPETQCTDNEVCVDSSCICSPDSCQTAAHECGFGDDGCGTPLDCGACSSSLHSCVGGTCIDVSPPTLSNFELTVRRPTPWGTGYLEDEGVVKAGEGTQLVLTFDSTEETVGPTRLTIAGASVPCVCTAAVPFTCSATYTVDLNTTSGDDWCQPSQSGFCGDNGRFEIVVAGYEDAAGNQAAGAIWWIPQGSDPDAAPVSSPSAPTLTVNGDSRNGVVIDLDPPVPSSIRISASQIPASTGDSLVVIVSFQELLDLGVSMHLVAGQTMWLVQHLVLTITL
eukprot:COSAG02_NODE_6439_length_3568_cov_2.991352_1_plen_753_part_00